MKILKAAREKGHVLYREQKNENNSRFLFGKNTNKKTMEQYLNVFVLVS